MSELKHVMDAGRLIAFGLSPHQRPSLDADYALLIRRALDEPSFAQTARAIAAGLGLVLLDLSEYGVVLGVSTREPSPFGLIVSDYRKGLSTEQRLLHGLVQVGIAAYLYPKPADLESDDEVRTVTVNALDDYLRELCDDLGQGCSDGGDDALADRPELERALHIFRRWPSTKATSSGRRSTRTTQGIISSALERLVAGGLLRRTGSGSKATYKALRRYRVQVRELASHRALKVLRREEDL